MVSLDYARLFEKKIRPLYWLRGEKLRRRLFVKFAFRRASLCALRRSEEISPVQRSRLAYRLQLLAPLAGTLARQVMRCSNSGRARFVLRRSGLSRMALRRYLHLGQLPGVIRASW